MAEVLAAPRTRINTGLISEHSDKPVCFVGRVQRVHPTGTSFILQDGEGKNVTVELTDPLDEELSGVVEVVGKVTNKASIMAVSYIPFREDKNSFVPYHIIKTPQSASLFANYEVWSSAHSNILQTAIK
ncbi:replication protein A 14 kDa subunit isoform X1 [Callorhinchus milii]|uniref:replication protein A 14 kDa subunit isoform X1 n=1 Tax=Callorhinchus milii TaxID=7868 RepID=UPI0004573B4B|nr:replication protein A 14 kDa subunit isoform X1 [Callorhinchus milii]|eukprot:gi/632973059/ref/XP_007902965.1/ PREDICTED: replication protein A 14 kDa subunit isoform X1 [Callorhinchus milii]